MMRKFLRFTAAFAIGCAAGWALLRPFSRHGKETCQPAGRWELPWLSRHRQLCKNAVRGPASVVFVGDSITQNWETLGADTWRQYYEPRNGLNFGISSDRTQHILWRVMEANFSEATPRVYVVLAGTNNSKDNDAADIADGVEAIISVLREKTPTAKILLMAIFPRGESVADPQRVTNDQTNNLLQQLADEKSVYFLDINSEFTGPDGSTNLDIMPDGLHPNEAGYAIWAASIESKLRELLGEDDSKPSVDNLGIATQLPSQ